jgi:hypothetical protein
MASDVTVRGLDELEQLAKARVRWSSVREPTVHTGWSRRSWSRKGRRGWGNAIGRPYDRVEIPGTAGIWVYLVLAAFVLMTVVLLLYVVGVLR